MNSQHSFLSGGGEMGELTRAKDWSKTNVGDPGNWKQSLRTTLSIILNSRFPMFLFWGPELICFYNDAYRPSLGKDGKHPAMLGGRAEDYWAEIWPVIKPLIDQVLAGGEATWSEDQFIPIYRNGKLEDVYWTFSYSPVIDETGKIGGILVTCNETTEKVINLKKLEESINQLQFAIDAAGFATWDFNPGTNKFTGNDRLKEWFGVETGGETDLDAVFDVIKEKDRVPLRQAIAQSLEFSSGGMLDMEYTIEHPVTKQVRIVRVKGRATFGAGNIAYRLNGTLQDVTQQVIARNQVEESEKEFRQLADSLPALVWTTDSMGAQTFASRRWKEYTGLDPYDESTFKKMVHSDEIENVLKIWSDSLATGKAYKAQVRLRSKDGNFEWFYINGEAVKNEQGVIEKWIGTFTNFNDQKNAEEELVAAFLQLEESEKRFRNTVQQAPLGITIFRGPDFIVEMANDTYLKLVDKPMADFIGKPLFKSLPEVKEIIAPLLNEVFTTGTPFHAAEFPVNLNRYGKTEDLSYFNLIYHPLREEGGDVSGVMVVASEVTSIVKAKHSLAESEQQFRNLVMQSHIPMAIFRGKDHTIEMGNRVMFERMWRKQESDVIGNKLLDVFPELKDQKYPGLLSKVYDVGETYRESESVAYIEGDDGMKQFYLDYQYTPLSEPDGQISGIMVTVNDVTEKVEARKKIEESEERLRMAIELTNLGTWEYNPVTGELNWSEECKKIYALPPGKQVDINIFAEQIYPADKDHVEKAIQQSMDPSGAGNYDITYRILQFNNNCVRWIKTQGKVIFNSQQIAERFIGTVVDITDQMQSQQVLAESEQRSRLAIEAAEMGTFDWDLITNALISSQRLNEIFGFPGKGSITHKNLLEAFHPDDKIRRDEAVQAAITARASLSYEARIIWPDKSIHWVRVYGKTIQNEQQQPVKIYGTVIDITAEKATITALEESTARLNVAIGAAELGMWELNFTTRNVFYSERYLQLLGFEKDAQPSHEELLRKVHPDDMATRNSAIKSALETGLLDFELRILPNQNNIRWIKAKGKVFYDEQHVAERMLGTIMDITEEKHSKQELIEREQKFRLLADSMPQFVWTGNTEGQLNYFNQSVYDYTGLSPEQIDKDGWLQIVHPDDREENTRKWQHAVTTGTDFLLEHRFRTRDGEYRWQLSRAIPQQDANGNIQMWVGTSTDIQDQKLWAEAIQKSELLFKTIANVSPVGLWMTDTNAQNTFVNDTWIAWTGEPMENQLGTGWLSKVVEEDKINAPSRFWDCLLKREKYVTEFRITGRGGALRWCLTEGAPYYDIHGNFAGYAGSVTDITERKLVQQELERKVLERTTELKKSEERNFRMVNEVQDYAILLLNREGIIENWNKGAERIKGYTAEEAIGNHIGLFYTAEDRKKNLPQQLIKKAVVTGKAWDEGWRVKKDGSMFWASVVITALHDNDDKIIGFSKVTRDLTERKMAEEKLKQTNIEMEFMNAALEKSNTELEQFAYVASHDLQEPLRKIRFFTERLEHSMINADTTAKDYYHKIQKATDRMNTLIKDLLDFSRLSNSNELFVKIDLNAVLDNVLNDLELLIQQKNAVVETAGLPVIEAIPLQMRQLFYNLLSNSLKFARKDIAPLIQLSCTPLAHFEQVKHNLDEELTYYEIVIQDNGIGFEQEYAEQIFVIFQRLNDLYTYGGTGIGLALCRKIALNHHGKIYATGKEGEGAVFHIILPKEQKINKGN